MSETLFDRIGGSATINAVVSDFYSRVYADYALSPYFERANGERLRHMQEEFFTAALGGPSDYSGMSLRDAHAGRGITTVQLTHFVEHLIEALRDRGLSSDDIDDVVSRVAMLADDIVGGQADAE